MKACTFATLLAAVYTSDAAQDEPHIPSESEIDAMFERFNKEFISKSQSNGDARRESFGKNVKQAIFDNYEQGVKCVDLFDDENCVFGITVFSDMSEGEFKATRLGYKRVAERLNMPVLGLDGHNASQSVDWRQKGAVTDVKDQGQCGSCWAFSTTEEVESQVFMKTGKLPVLSTQQIISCDKGSDDGCDGGDPVTAYQYIEKAGGLDSASDYPDKSHISGNTGKCTWDKKTVAKVSGFTYATKPCDKGKCKNQDEDALAAALDTKGPISICVNAGGNGWQNYKSGVFSKRCSGASSALDHCVQLVGYNKNGKTPYWIVRNSWNTDWGIKGYMHLEMGKNLCGVADEATIAEATLVEETTVVV